MSQLRGRVTKAEDGYRLASRWGRDPQPGLALIRMAQGQVEVAAAAIRWALDEAVGNSVRSRLLGPYVEITLAAGENTAARQGAVELQAVAAALDIAFLRALASYTTAAVLLAEGDAPAALPFLRQARRAWRDLGAPYDAARTRVLIGLACQAVGDDDSADMELDAARLGFEQLGAIPDLARLDIGPCRMPAGLRYAAIRFGIRPTARNAERLERFALHDLEITRHRDPGWFAVFDAYLRSRAAVPHVRPTMRRLVATRTGRISDDELRRIQTPTDLVWGRHDRMVPLHVADGASRALGWPLHVIDGAGHVPHLEQPRAFVRTLTAIERTTPRTTEEMQRGRRGPS